MEGYEIVGTVPPKTAAELVDESGWMLHALVEQDGDMVTLIRNDELLEVLQVTPPEEPPGPWPDA